MRKSVYIESSIIGYLTARPSRDLVTAARLCETPCGVKNATNKDAFFWAPELRCSSLQTLPG
jgi:hypothetical protein